MIGGIGTQSTSFTPRQFWLNLGWGVWPWSLGHGENRWPEARQASWGVYYRLDISWWEKIIKYLQTKVSSFLWVWHKVNASWGVCSRFLAGLFSFLKKYNTNERREDQAERSHCSLHIQNLFAGQSWRMVDSLLHYTPASRWGAQQSVCSHRPSFPWLEPTAVTGASKHKHDLRKKTPPSHQHSRIWSFSFHLGQTLIIVNEEKVLPHQHFVELHEKTESIQVECFD